MDPGHPPARMGCHSMEDVPRQRGTSSNYLIVYGIWFLKSSRFFKLLLHRRVAPCEFLDGQVFGLVVGEPEVVLRAEECLLDFLEVVDGFVDFLDGFPELFAGQAEVFSEFVLEFKQSVLEVGHVDALASCDFKLLAEL